MQLPNKQLLSVMQDAYSPCKYFGTCREARWSPTDGQIPRGFIGATRSLEDVKVVMVFAEPGHPHHDECYDPALDANGLLESGMKHPYECYKSGRDQFHRNVRWFMSQLYSNLSFDQQLQHVWLTEGRLCSIDNEIGNTRDRTCASHYLSRQIALLPNATIVAFGGKAQYYLKNLNIEYLTAYALAPPGANHKPARPSWERVINEIMARSSE